MIKSGVLGLVLIFAAVTAHAEMKPVFDTAAKMSESRAVLYFSSQSRFDLNILAEFVSDCETYENISCICAGEGDVQTLKESFASEKFKDCIHTGANGETPRIEFYKEGKAAGAIGKGGNFAGLTPVYLSYISGQTDEAGLAEKIRAAESAETFKKIVPSINFVLMLAKKGRVDSALKELGKIDVSRLDNKGKLLIGETYLRLKSPAQASEVLLMCDDAECLFYAGIAQHLNGENQKALATLTSLKGRYTDENKLNYYLKTIYEALGDKENADKIRLHDNYNVNTD
jgi:hypothetical protein